MLGAGAGLTKQMGPLAELPSPEGRRAHAPDETSELSAHTGAFALVTGGRLPWRVPTEPLLSGGLMQ